MKTWLQLVTLFIGACLGWLLGVAVGYFVRVYILQDRNDTRSHMNGYPTWCGTSHTCRAYRYRRSRLYFHKDRTAAKINVNGL